MRWRKFPIVLVPAVALSAAACGGASRLASNELPPAREMVALVKSPGPVVTSTSDNGPGSLRRAVATAKTGDTITIHLRRGAVILLTSGSVVIAKSIRISGPGAASVSVSANGRSGLFSIGKRNAVTIAGITLTKGSAPLGGAIYNAGSLALQNDAFVRNTAPGAGGGSAAVGSHGARLRFDPRPRGRDGRAPRHPAVPAVPKPAAGSAAGQGGAIYSAIGAKLSVEGTTFAGNSAALGGAIYNAGMSMLSTDSFRSNVGFRGGGATAYGYGGAIFDTGKLAVTKCSFLLNVVGGSSAQSYGAGGAIAQYAGVVSVAQTNFASNLAGGGSNGSWGTGGAIYTTGGALSLSNDTFTSNEAGGDAYGFGGAVYADQRFKGRKITFNRNAAFGSGSGGYAYGGAVYAGSGLSLSGGGFSANTASGGRPTAYGYSFGGALDSEAAATLGSLTFTGNTASGGFGGSAEGGAIYLGGGTSRWGSLRFSGNSAASSGASSYAGGGAVAEFGALTIAGTSSFTSNNASSAAANALGAQGGALLVEVGPLAFTGTATGNAATTQGGALWIDDVATVTNALLSGNTASAVQSPDDGGGGVYVGLGGAITMTGSTLTANTTSGSAPYTGGGGVFNEGGGSIENSTFELNSSSVDGGGIENEAAGGLVLANVTVYQNSALGRGGNLKNLYPDASLNLDNSIVAGGEAAGAPSDISNDGTIISGDYNIVQNPPSGNALGGTTTHNLAVDPQISALANNGGPTPTSADGPGSPGTAYIPYNFCLAVSVTVDQRGLRRDATNNGFCDVGAYEDQTP